MPTPTKITLRLTAAGLELVAEYASAVVTTTGEEITEVRECVLPGLRKTRPVAEQGLRVAGGAK